MFFSVTSAKRSVGAVSKTGTTTERRPASTLNRSIAASRRWYGTGLRLVFSWFADVTAHTMVAPGHCAQVLRLEAGQHVVTAREQHESELGHTRELITGRSGMLYVDTDTAGPMTWRPRCLSEPTDATA